MNTTFRITAAAALLSVAACSQGAQDAPALTSGAWTVAGDASELAYVSIKADEIAEINTFDDVTGSISADGAAAITIDLASVDTGVDIRNERMRDIFFAVADHPVAAITAQIDPSAFAALGIGDSTQQTLDGTLSLKGVEAPFQAEVSVTRIGADRVMVVSDAPVIVDAGQFELVDELAMLQDLAGLPSITPVVPVTFSITFER